MAAIFQRLFLKGGSMEFTERFLYHIWDGQHLLKSLKTCSGKELLIDFPGRWNTDSGPDFKDCIIHLDGKIFRGDVEVDLTNFEWRHHGHDENPQFNTVILHVVYQHHSNHPFTIKENGDAVEVLEVHSQLDRDISKLLKRYAELPFKETDKYCHFFTGVAPEIIASRLEKLGMERLEGKVRRFAAEREFSDFDQLAYEGIMEALGYSKNKFQMLKLSLVCNYAEMQKRFFAEEDAAELLGYLVKRGGLADHLPRGAVLSKRVVADPPLDVSWTLFRIRPGNHPVVRLAQIAPLLQESFADSLFHRIVRLFSFTQGDFSVREFLRRTQNYFSRSAQLINSAYRLGATRIDTLVINIIVPLVLLYAREENFVELEQTTLQIYSQMHKLPENYILHTMEQYMDDSQKRIVRAKGIYQQGLLKLYADCCHDHNCNRCAEF